MKIGLDLDDVIIDFYPSFLKFYNKKYDKNRNIESLTSFYLWESGIGENKEEAIKLVDEFYDSPEFDLMPLVNEADRGVRKLSELSSNLYVITSRSLRFKDKTENSLKKYFPDIPLEILYSFGLEQQKETKADICERLGIETIIEDAPDHAQLCSVKGIRTFLMDKPWNKNLNGKLERVYNWNEILEKIGGTQNEQRIFS